MKKLLSAILVLAMMLTLSAVTVSAEEKIAFDADKAEDEVIADFTDMTKITGTWDGGKEHAFDGTKLKITEDVCGNITGLWVTGVEPGIYKVGYFLTVNTIKDSDNPPEDTSDDNGMQDWRFRLNPYGTYVNMPYYPCQWNGLTFTGLSTVVGQKIIGVAVIKVNEDCDIEMLAWPLNGYMDATLDRIVFAGADYDFGPANYPDYTIFYEGAPHEGDAAKLPAEGDWTESILEVEEDDTPKDDTTKDDTTKDDTTKDDTTKDDTTKDDTTKDDTTKDDTTKDDTTKDDTTKDDTTKDDTTKDDTTKDDTTKDDTTKDDTTKDDTTKDDTTKNDTTTNDTTNDDADNSEGTNKVPQTGDVSIMLAVVAAGAAALGGLKLRKK